MSKQKDSFLGRGCFFLLLLGCIGLRLLLLDELRKELLVLGLVVLGKLVAVELDLLDHLLSADALVGDQALDLGALVEGLVTLLHLSADNVFADIVGLSEREHLADGGSSLWSKASRSFAISDSRDVSVSLLGDRERDDGKIGAGDASTDTLPLAFTLSSLAVGTGSYN